MLSCSHLPHVFACMHFSLCSLVHTFACGQPNNLGSHFETNLMCPCLSRLTFVLADTSPTSMKTISSLSTQTACSGLFVFVCFCFLFAKTAKTKGGRTTDQTTTTREPSTPALHWPKTNKQTKRSALTPFCAFPLFSSLLFPPLPSSSLLVPPLLFSSLLFSTLCYYHPPTAYGCAMRWCS